MRKEEDYINFFFLCLHRLVQGHLLPEIHLPPSPVGSCGFVSCTFSAVRPSRHVQFLQRPLGWGSSQEAQWGSPTILLQTVAVLRTPLSVASCPDLMLSWPPVGIRHARVTQVPVLE